MVDMIETTDPVAKLTTPAGEKLVVLSEAEYERLVGIAEDAADIAAADRVLARIASGEDELIPSEIANRLFAGENPVKVWREHRGLTARTLAEKAELSAPYVSQLETGEREGSIDAMRKIAAALRVSIDDLVLKVAD